MVFEFISKEYCCVNCTYSLQKDQETDCMQRCHLDSSCAVYFLENSVQCSQLYYLPAKMIPYYQTCYFDSISIDLSRIESISYLSADLE